ncbi:MAG: hypothetical protein ACRDJV_11125 [Actinomycetota bacterium]
MLDYLAYIWARDITEETTGDRTRLLSEVLGHGRPRSGRARRMSARALRALAKRLEPAAGRAPEARPNA